VVLLDPSAGVVPTFMAGHAKDVAYLAAEEDAEPFERKMLRLVASCASSRPRPGA